MKRMCLLFVLPFFLVFLILCGCSKELAPLTVLNQTYQTDYGIVTQVDDYPLFSMTYSSDYNFDEYLESGNIPYFTGINAGNKNFSCTCFTAFGGEKRLMGRNYDWSQKSSYYLVYTDPPDGYRSVSTVDLSFFSYANDKSPSDEDNREVVRVLPYYPFDGMNENGVAVGMNAIPGARSPYNASKVTIGELQMIRLILDYAASTEEALSLVRQYNIRMEQPPIHYLIADSSGHSVIVEFISGEMIVMPNKQPWQVTTNFIITGLSSPSVAPCIRYRTAHSSLESNQAELNDGDAFDVLHSVSVPITRWSTVFDLKTGQVRVAMGRDFGNIHSFTLTPF